MKKKQAKPFRVWALKNSEGRIVWVGNHLTRKKDAQLFATIRERIIRLECREVGK